MDSTPTSTPRRQQRDRLRLITQLAVITGNLRKKLSVTFKIANDESTATNDVDDDSMALLAMPDGVSITVDQPPPSFHSFVITCQTGQRIFGASMLFTEKQLADDDQAKQLDLPTGHRVVFVSKCLVALTCRPLVDQLRPLLFFCAVEADCNPRWLRAVAQIRLPAKGRCFRINLPKIRKFKRIESSPRDDGSSSPEDQQQICIFRPLSALPLFDYSLRQLFFEILSPEQFLLAFSCALMETQILITSSDYHNLMLVAESLTSLLNPFKWQHVYVPILPNKLGLHYLDAPTPFIMGINSKYAVNNNSIQHIFCKINCDQSTVECNIDSIVLPPFLEDLRSSLESILGPDLKLSPSMTKSAKSSEALKRMTELAKKHHVIDELGYLDDLKMNQRIRLLFYKTLRSNILPKSGHQQFILPGVTKKESIKFDGVSYLSDQPLAMREFLSQFIEAQMFATFIDETAKLMRRQQRAQSVNNIQVVVQDLDQDEDGEELDEQFNDELLEARFNAGQVFELADFEEIPTLAPTTIDTKIRALPSPISSPRMRRRRLNGTAVSLANIKDSVMQSPAVQSPGHRVPAALAAQTNWRVVETLIREVKNKTKRILLEKMGSDEVGMLGCGSVGGLEENTMIASLCDLIERIWSHGRTDIEDLSNPNQRCSFWSHLLAYNQLENPSLARVAADQNKTLDSSMLTPALSQMSVSTPSKTSSPPTPTSSPSRKANTSSNQLKPLPTTLFYDLRSICLMTDIKTEVGKSRAFIRLALERKLLSKHLRTLLGNQDLLMSLYKRYAFVRCEEEREMFLTHLLTLNAVDLMCFTNTFTTSTLPYSLVVYGSGQFNGWFSVTGTSSATTEIDVANNCSLFNFKHRNLGQLLTLTLSCGHSSKLFVECCFVRNDVTGHVFKFACHRWFGRNIDDGAIERVLIGELLTGQTIADAMKKCHQNRSSSIGRNWTRSSDPDNEDDQRELTVEELQTMFGENVNHLMKLYFTNEDSIDEDNVVRKKYTPVIKPHHSSTLCKSRHAKNRSLLNLLYGQRKLLWVLQRIFYYGFKNRGRSSFRKQNYLWDYLLRVQCELKIASQCHTDSRLDQADRKAIVDKLIEMVEAIASRATNYGKDSKFQLFLVLSIRDHLIHQFFSLLTRPSLASLFYEQKSFLREQSLIMFLSQIFETFNDVNLVIDRSLTKDL